MPDETSRRYLFVAIDRATRWVCAHIYGDMTDTSIVDFLRRLKLASPSKSSKILTNKDAQFIHSFATKDKKPSGKHSFGVACAGLPAEHRLALPRHPQTNSMVERFNGRINELLQDTRFDSRADLQATFEAVQPAHSTRAIALKRPFWHSRSGNRNGPSYSLNALIVERNSTFSFVESRVRRLAISSASAITCTGCRPAFASPQNKKPLKSGAWFIFSASVCQL